MAAVNFMESMDEDLLVSIKTDMDVMVDEDGLTNTVLLDEDVKMEAIAEAASNSEDPLNILNKPEDRNEIADSFIGEFDEKDLLNEDSALVEDPPPEVGPSRSKRMRGGVDLKGRNGYVWNSAKPVATALLVNRSIAPRGKGPARVVSNMLEAWHLLMDEPILQAIVKHTNEEIKRRKSKLPSQRCTDVIEVRAWIGLNYLCGVFRPDTDAPLEELWTPELGNGIFRATMSLKRFEFLADCLCMVEEVKRESRMESVIQPVRGIWDKFIINCRSYYAPSGNCAINEHVIDITDTSFSMTKSDSERQDLRVVSLHDAKTLYMCNAVIGPSGLTGGREEVFALVCDIKGTNRNVTLSEQYTSLELANQLLQCQLTLVGALPASAQEIPTEFLTSKSRKPLRKVYSGAISLTSQDKNPPLLLTSGISDKVNVLKLFEVTHRSGRRFHEIAQSLSTSSAQSSPVKYHWSLRLFHAILDFACVNSWVLVRVSEKGTEPLKKRDFQRRLGLFLTQQHLKRRVQKKAQIPLQLKLLITEILGESTDKLISDAVVTAAQESSAGTLPIEKSSLPENIQLLSKTMEKRNRCRVCPSKKNTKTRWQCQQCGRALCFKHMVMRCEGCTGIKRTSHSVEDDEYFM